MVFKFILLLAGFFMSYATDEIVYNITEFHSKLFWKIQPSGLYSADIGMTQDKYIEEGIYVVHVADVNADSYNDLVTLDKTN